ncbi:metallophosphoesterase family protein [Carnimonas nigrificans]|uniref:metallophosphoesterase family protein n=1 Tax=Carnimonas nigrificans TaxID=64323 RepID=UPI000471A6CC|nr:DNA repair exonuclease [Carnimonas nigrificans]
MLRLLHTADWQIGKSFGQFDPDEASLLAQARIDAIGRLATLADQHWVDVVLVAGDVFDAQTVADKTIHRVFNAMQAFSGQWVLIPGNHDAALAESVWSRAERLGAVPDNVALCLTPQPLVLDALKLTLLPAPLTQRHTYQDLTAWFDHADSPAQHYRIGLAHGSVQGVLDDSIDSANPIASERVSSAHLDYLALGDWHGVKEINPRCWYAGTPEPDRFRSNDSGHALLVSLEAPQATPSVEIVDTGSYRWHQQHYALRVDSDVDALEQWLASLNDHDVVELSLEGTLDLALHHRLERSLNQAQGRVRSLRLELHRLRIAPSEEDLAQLAADGYVGEVIDELKNEQHGEHGDTARDALILLADLLGQRRDEEASQ